MRRKRGRPVGDNELPGIKRVRGRVPGQVYFYHRKTMRRIEGEFGSPVFLESLARIERAASIPGKPRLATVGAAIDAWRKSPNWAALSPATRKSYERALLILDGLRDMPGSELTRGFVLKMRDEVVFKKHKRWMANYVVTVLSLVLAHAADRELFGKKWKNPLAERVKHIRAPKREVQANRPWSREECSAVMARAPIHLRIPLALAMFAGLRKGDVLRVTMSDVKDGHIAIRTKKRDQPVSIPVHAALDAALALRPKSDAVQIAVNAFGEPWTESGFNASWAKLRRKLVAAGEVAPGLTIHGLRHTMGTRLREAGAEDRDIADVLGQATTAMARHYSKNAEMPERTRGIVLNLDQAGKRARRGTSEERN